MENNPLKPQEISSVDLDIKSGWIKNQTGLHQVKDAAQAVRVFCKYNEYPERMSEKFDEFTMLIDALDTSLRNLNIPLPPPPTPNAVKENK